VLVARATALSFGKSQAVTRCGIYALANGEERLCAAAQGTITVVRGAAPSDTP
jgi:acyl-coenzyme A thioesterase PaaI-like protein